MSWADRAADSLATTPHPAFDAGCTYIDMELLARGTWSGAGVLGPEAFAPLPFLELLKDEYGSPWGLEERSPAR